VEEKSETAFRNLVKSADFIVPWSHYLKLMQIQDPQTRLWYEREAAAEGWDIRTLQRNISTQYFERLLISNKREPVKTEMHALTTEFQRDARRFVKNPYILEFLDLPEDPAANESMLESALITNIGKFLMELGRGYAFIARQQHIRTEKEDYYIDLVFYNYMLKCFVLIDLKVGKVTYQDVGQMDMYVQMYDERKKASDDNPTLGIILCSDTDEDVARYSGLRGNEQLFASKYKLYLPTDQQLRTEIETQKEIFYMQHPELKEED
jgi:predicted nuclease of restriction endonuclease-like (RecB) superfamily